jgi:hypothetical protein
METAGIKACRFCFVYDSISPQSEELVKEQPIIENEVSDETGEFDPRFALWREFCANRGVPVDSLPSNLSAELKKRVATP